ncbi:MAG: D-alanyl-lipoteichoic acid biosynthesis protein DltD [Firmicutes bacterium]|nr:D-alanyl-lipoteichoic acid biosynthesis protein DltD [Bacillota bacterium]
MVRQKLIPLGLAILLFSLSILAVGPVTQMIIDSSIKPGVIETVAETPYPDLFKETLLQRAAIKMPDVIPIYGSSEFNFGGIFNPTKFFAGKPTGWTPYLIGHAGSENIIQALYVGGQNFKGKKIALSLSAQWFEGNGISQNTFGANFSALQVYKLMLNPTISAKTKSDIAKRLTQFDELKKNYPILERYLRDYGQSGWKAIMLKFVYWPACYLEMAALEVGDFSKTINVLEKLPAKEIARNAKSKPSGKLPNWSTFENKAIADAKLSESNNPFGVTNTFYDKNRNNIAKLKNSQANAHFYPSQQYNDLDLLMRVLKDEGAEPIFIIQPVNGFWYDFTGFPKEQRQKYYDQIRQMALRYGFALADFSGHEYDMYFMSDPSHPDELGWVKINHTLDNFVNQNQKK